MTRKTFCLKEWSWFKINNLGLVLDMVLKFSSSVGKESKLKVRKLCGLILTFGEVAGEKLVEGGVGLFPPSNKTSWRHRNDVSLYVPAKSQLRLK